MASTRVVLPWSTSATMATLWLSWRVGMLAGASLVRGIGRRTVILVRPPGGHATACPMVRARRDKGFPERGRAAEGGGDHAAGRRDVHDRQRPWKQGDAYRY